MPGARWFTSSYSTGNGGGGSCVEVAFVGRTVAVRDTKDRAGGMLTIPGAAWSHLLSHVAR
ncbi:DUF397 domain-containing protein [Amycolatopsis cihanbeyliensis]|uniref:Uncharacterized protein DUF397 n=1 Tax=Amycolatopsis cihanbeyliensis TaxID=1128664 RepID=A0A542DL65_AMYCI|nr:DUF397 domain-containing protein [Amycolatopsis cihanbeyliensis]TQJ03840.1 uncharacterized protein DUF397 [Amycolatopsis cihanbeyliensis]